MPVMPPGKHTGAKDERIPRRPQRRRRLEAAARIEVMNQRLNQMTNFNNRADSSN
jgi:hypothetical protein